MNDILAQKAISLALSGNWEEAKKVNKEILENDPGDIDALNRYARACAETGNIRLAKTSTKKVLDLDPYNSIAQKSLEKWKKFIKSDSNQRHISADESFLEEPGKTKIVLLMHLGKEEVISNIAAGEEVKLKTQGHRISVCTQDNEYIGRISDDVSSHLKNLMQHGNLYKAMIKSAKPKAVCVFIKEIKRVKELSTIPSFTSERIDYIPFEIPSNKNTK